jgi:hypothetical protein
LVSGLFEPGWDGIDYVAHKEATNLVHAEYYRGDNNGSNQHDNSAFDNLAFCWPRSLVPQLGIRLLNIRK